MTFRSLYRLEARGLLNCPIIGVAGNDWSVDQLRDRARTSIEGTGEQLDEDVFERFADRLSYVQGDFADPATFKRVGEAIGSARTPVFYLEIPPFLFATVIKGLSEAGLTAQRAGGRREAVRPRPRVGARAGRRHPSVHRRVAALPDRSLPREDGAGGVPVPAVRELDARADLEPQPHRERADHDGRELRRRGSRPLLRSRRRAARRRRQPPHAARGRGRDGGPGAARTPTRSRMRSSPCSARCRTPIRRTTSAASTTATSTSTASAADSTTETYAALRLEIDNWRWAGVPWFIRTGKRLPVTQTEVRLVFRRPPRLRFLSTTAAAAARREPARDQARPDRPASG